MSWQILIVFCIFFASFATILQRVLLKGDSSDPVAYSIVFQMLNALFIGAFGLLTTKMVLPDVRAVWVQLVAMVVLYGFGNVLIFRALQELDASRFIVIFTSRALFTVLASTLFLHEVLTVRQLLGSIFIISGVLLALKRVLKFSFGRGEMFALAAAVCFGVGTTNDRLLLTTFSVYPYVFLAFLLPGLFLALLYPKAVVTMKVFLKAKMFVKMFALCIVYSLSAITFYSALQASSNSSQLALIYQISTITTVLLAVVVLREKENLLYKIIGATVSFMGLLLMA